jgi:hypothetical protein
LFSPEHVVISPASAFFEKDAGLLQVLDNHLNRSLGDADSCGDVSEPYRWVISNAHQDVTVVGEIRPRVLSGGRTHISNIA